MKKTLLIVASFFAAGAISAQQRLVLVEAFSQASCAPCAAQNPELNALLANNTTKVVSVKYQTSWPGYDPMNLQNAGQIASRVSYYGISGVPDRIQDGTNQNITQTGIDTRYAVPSPVTMTISHTISADFATADITVTINAPAIWNPANTVLQLAMVEKLVSFPTPPGTNGEMEFHSVMRKMYPSETGTPVVASNFATAGGTQTFTFTGVAIPSYIYDLREIAFVAWVQNNTTKEVYQAGLSEPATLSNLAVVDEIDNPANLSCNAQLANVSTDLENQGTNAITSATVNYKVDNGTVLTAPFTGNIAPGSTAPFALPAIPSTSGSHTLTVWLSNINASGSAVAVGTNSTTFATITDAGLTGPYSQNFSSSAFPYSNFHLASATASNWARVSTNSGSMRFAAYAYTAGNTGDMIMAPIDLTSIAGAQLMFDVAYAQYSSENDKLQVQISTDCGATWATVYDKAGATLSTAAATQSSFVPTASQWRQETVDLAAYASSTKAFIKFKGISAYGNNMYVDKILVQNPLGLETESVENFVVFPNPATDVANISFEGNGGDYTIRLTDLSGREMSSKVVSNAVGPQAHQVSVAGLASGNYLVVISSNNSSTTQQLVVQ